METLLNTSNQIVIREDGQVSRELVDVTTLAGDMRARTFIAPRLTDRFTDCGRLYLIGQYVEPTTTDSVGATNVAATSLYVPKSYRREFYFVGPVAISSQKFDENGKLEDLTDKVTVKIVLELIRLFENN